MSSIRSDNKAGAFLRYIWFALVSLVFKKKKLLGAGGFDGHLGCGRIISISPHAFLHALFLSTLMSCDAQKTSVNAVLSFRNRQPALTDCNYVLPGTRSVCRTKCAGKHCEDYWVVLYKMSITHLACFAPLSAPLVSCYISFWEIDLLINGANNICWYPVKMFTGLLACGMCYKCYRIQVLGGGKVWIFCIWKLCGHYPTGHGFVDRSSVSGWQIRDRTMLDLLAFSWTLWGEKMCRTWVKSHAAKCIVRLIIPPIAYEPALS